MLYLKTIRSVMQILQNNELQSLANLLCVRLEKNSFAGWPKRKIIRRSGSGHGTGLVEALA